MRIPLLMKTILRVVVTTFAGGLVGALLGVIVFAAPVYFDHSPLWYGTVSDLSGVVALLASVYGALFGIGIGLVTGIAKPSHEACILIGAVSGLVALICLLSDWDRDSLFAVLILGQLCILLSVITGAIARWFGNLITH